MTTEPLMIVGAGPVGLSLALRLIREGVAVKVLEAKPQGAFYQDHRALALSQASKLMLQALGVWELLPQVTPIDKIHISQKGSLGRSLLKSSDYDLPALGYVLSYGHLMQAIDTVLQEQIKHAVASKIDYQVEVKQILPDTSCTSLVVEHQNQQSRLTTPLAVIADGGRSLADIPGIHRVTKAYGHHALVTKVSADLPHKSVAYERFTAMGPVALLPNGEHEFSLVWTGASESIQPLLDLPDAEFLQQLHHHFGDRVGKFNDVQKRIAFPLKLAYLDPVTSQHLVVVGNAAQTMHPVAGQGFNVGLRDAWDLADLIVAAQHDEIGTPEFLQQYQQTRQKDTKRGIQFTDFLVQMFSNDMLGLSALRSAGLGLFDMFPPAKAHLIRKMSFGSKG